MKATKGNICDILGVHATGITFSKQNLKNGFALKGFMNRYALQDLMNNFHVYVNKENAVVVITTGRLNVTGRV